MSNTADEDEVHKVTRRLKLWAQKPWQINARVLIAFLELERKGYSPVTEQALRAAFADDSFDTNFSQMKHIAPHNHGKIFDQNGATLSIWPPVRSAVREFEIEIFLQRLQRLNLTSKP